METRSQISPMEPKGPPSPRINNNDNDNNNNNNITPYKKKGGWTAIKYILGNESFEKLASMSLVGNMTVYLRSTYNMSGIFLVNAVTIWNGTSNIAPLAGAYVSDAYLGRFLTLVFGTISTILGMGTVTLTAAIPQLRPPACAEGEIDCLQPHKWQLAFLFIGLGLLSIGAGGIRPCNIAFGADQFDTKTEKGRHQLESFFNWWYFSFTIALLIALTGVVYVQTNVSWLIGFAIPTACIGLSFIIFLMGRHTYICKKPQGSIFLDLAKVFVAALHKKRVNTLENESIYDPPLNQEVEAQFSKLPRTIRFKWVDKAAIIVDPSELNEEGMPKNCWRLCSVQQVEQLKCLVGIIPVWIAGICCFVVMDQSNTFGMLQALQMDKSIGPHHFDMPPAWMTVTSMIALAIWIFIYEHIYVPNAKKILKRESRFSIKQRIRVGILISIICMFVAGAIEKKRRDSALKQGFYISPITVFWLLPQFCLAGLTEAFGAVAVMEFLTTQMPESMRSVAGAIFFLSLSIASYLSSLIVSIIHGLSGIGGRTPWLGGHDLNRNRLEYYFYIIGWLGIINFFYFTFFASKYVESEKVVSSYRKVVGLEEPVSYHYSRNLSKQDNGHEEN